MYRSVILLTLASLGLLWAPSIDAAGFELKSSVIGAAGSPGSSASFNSNGTLGQSSSIGPGGSTTFVLTGGFWSKLQTATGIFEAAIPPIFRNALLPNAPNPFNPVTSINFEVSKQSPVIITIFNIKGQAVRNLVREVREPGRYEILWDGKNNQGRQLASGVFFCQFQVGEFSDVRKMLLLK